MSRLAATLLLLGAAGAIVAASLAAFQLGIIDAVWEPVFGDGSERVLTSALSRALPVPDALLGFLAYVVDIALTLLVARGVGGGTTRLALAVWAGLGALASVGLILVQAFVVRAFCTLCLVSAGISWALAAGAVIAWWRDIEFHHPKEAEST
jgi:uncharacterized membrane protein